MYAFFAEWGLVIVLWAFILVLAVCHFFEGLHFPPINYARGFLP